MNIEDWRKLAEFYLCPNCIQIYKVYFEPSIRHLLLNPIEDWKEVEFYINQMVMKNIGVFKGDEVDENAYKKITKKCNFPSKIDYLLKMEILQESSAKLLVKANEARNKIHGVPFSEQELKLFSIAHAVTYNIWSATMFERREDISTNLRDNAEKVAEQYLLNQNIDDKCNHNSP